MCCEKKVWQSLLFSFRSFLNCVLFHLLRTTCDSLSVVNLKTEARCCSGQPTALSLWVVFSLSLSLSLPPHPHIPLHAQVKSDERAREHLDALGLAVVTEKQFSPPSAESLSPWQASPLALLQACACFPSPAVRETGCETSPEQSRFSFSQRAQTPATPMAPQSHWGRAQAPPTFTMESQLQNYSGTWITVEMLCRPLGYYFPVKTTVEAKESCRPTR